MPRGQYSKTYDMTDVRPRYRNSCPNCIFLGRFSYTESAARTVRADLYYCKRHEFFEDDGLRLVFVADRYATGTVQRFSRPQAEASIGAHKEFFAEVLKRAKERGLL